MVWTVEINTRLNKMMNSVMILNRLNLKKMKCILCILILLSNATLLYSQQENNWIKFEDEKSLLIGYKNSKGEIEIKPKFTFITNAEIFEHIIAVFEEVNLSGSDTSIMKQYYLLKNGKQVGIDSLYVFDTTLDCERENKIRFRDYKTDKVGFFDREGKITIPAMYDDAKPFYNGFAVVILDGKRMCWNGSGEYSTENMCEMWRWRGNIQIINDKNKVIANHIPYEKLEAIDWFSVHKNTDQLNANYIEFKSDSGDTYSFLNYKKEFEQWYYNQFLKDISTDALNTHLSDEIYYDVNKTFLDENKILFKDSFWKKETKELFLKNHSNYYSKTIKQFKTQQTDILEGLSPTVFRFQENPEYFTNCGAYQHIKYPYFEVYLLNKNNYPIKTLGFIKINNAFKLLEIH